MADITPLIVPSVKEEKGDEGLNGPVVESNIEKKSNAVVNSNDKTVR